MSSETVRCSAVRAGNTTSSLWFFLEVTFGWPLGVSRGIGPPGSCGAKPNELRFVGEGLSGSKGLYRS